MAEFLWPIDDTVISCTQLGKSDFHDEGEVECLRLLARVKWLNSKVASCIRKGELS